MANYRKSFNLRYGVQVDDDNFIVNPNGLVGIGTSIPTEFLDVRGNVKVVGHTTSNTSYSGVSTIGSLNVSNGAIVSGVITATSFSGSASGLTDIYAIAIDGWYVDTINSTISTSFKVGIGTTLPEYSLQIGQNPLLNSGVAIESSGNIRVSGAVTATNFVGTLDASNLSGVVNNSRLPSNIDVGIITASSGFYGNLTGTASTANSITNSANIIVNSINSGFSTSGIATIHNNLYVGGNIDVSDTIVVNGNNIIDSNIGIGTLTPNAQLHGRKTGISSIQLTSDGSNSSILTIGRSVSITSNNGQLRFGNTNISYPYSTEESLDLINYDTGNLNFYINPGGAGTGSYNWFKPNLGLSMTLTSSGNLGVNSTTPSSRLSIVGDAYITGVTTITGGLTAGAITSSSITTGNGVFQGKVGISTDNPLYDIQAGGVPTISNGVGISSSGNVIASGKVTSANMTVSGIVTSNGGFTSGTGGPVQISVSGSTLILTVPGVGSTVLTIG